MEPRECFDDLLFRKLLLVTTLDKQSKTFPYNFDMFPDVYAIVCMFLENKEDSFILPDITAWFVVRGLEVRSQFAPTPWWPCRWPSTSRASEHSGSWRATAVLPRHSKRFQQCRIIQGCPRTPRQCSLSLFSIFARFTVP